ncbi:hypothetical protein BDF21DRAFT_345960 [Thamnidium elegans]|nr:hypothetical protein BDF21DRAFT_345960 [Thamnidium elegans]
MEPSAFDKMKMGATMGGTVGLCIGFVFGSISFFYICVAIGSVVRSENRLPVSNMNLPVLIKERKPFQQHASIHL